MIFFFEAIIVAAYFVFAAQLSAKIEWRGQSQGARAVVLLMGVFIACAITGYAMDLIDIPPFVAAVSHGILAFLSVMLVATRQADHIAEMMRQDHD